MTEITSTERKQRERYIRGGQWDDCILYLDNDTNLYVRKSQVNSDGQLECIYGTTVDEQLLTLDIAQVVRVVR